MFKKKVRVSCCITLVLLALSIFSANLDKVYMKLCPDEYNFMLEYFETSVSDFKAVSKNIDEYYDTLFNYFKQNRNPWAWVTLICNIESDKLGVSNSKFFLRAMSDESGEEVSFTEYSNEELEAFISSGCDLRSRLYQQSGWMSLYFSKLEDAGTAFNESLDSDSTTADIKYIDNYFTALSDVQYSSWVTSMVYFFVLAIFRVLTVISMLVTIVLLIKQIKISRGVKNGLTTN